MLRRTPWRAAMAAAFAVALFVPALAHAAPPVVKTVPWVATNPLIAHDTYATKAVTLKGTADVQGATITYRWQFGDGTPDATGTVTNMYAIEATHTYAGSVGDIFAATLTVTNTATAESASAAYLVQMRAKTLDVEANIAIDEGLWYLHKNFYRYDSGGKKFGSWITSCGGGVCAGYASLQGANASAFFVNGHRVDGAASNPYTETVQRAMRRFFELLSSGTPTSETYTAGTYNPAPSVTGTIDPDCLGCAAGDPSNNNIFLYIAGSDVYQSGIATAALASSGTPTAVADTGGIYTNGRTYRAILQDMVDYWGYAQNENGAGSGFGGWHYGADYGSADNSTAQWGAIGLLASEGFGKAQYSISDPGIQVEELLRMANRKWIGYSFAAISCTGGGCGAFGYSSPSYYPWGPWATTPSGMVQMAFNRLGRNGTDTKWEQTEKYVRLNFPNTGGASVSIRDYYYGLYAFVKAMLLHVDEGTGLRAPITLLGGDLDWYAAEISKGDATDGVARTLINDQSAAHWNGHYYTGEQTYFETTWAIQMLNRTITESGAPVAVATAVPNPAVAGSVVKLDGTASFHQDPSKHIVKWEWDVGLDGTIDFTGPIVFWTAPAALGDYQIRLIVTDDFVPSGTDDTIVTVDVAIPPLAPTADANGPYNFCPARTPWFLDGSGSVNPDEGAKDPQCPTCPGDTIVSWAWDLDTDGTYDIANNKTPDVTAYFMAKPLGSYLVRLKVTDRTSQSFPGMADLFSTDTAQVNVLAGTDPKCACTVLKVRGAGLQAQLKWTNVGAASYNIYRSTVTGGPYVKITSVPGSQLMFIDGQLVSGQPVTSGLVAGTTYFWVVRPVSASAEELCQSNQVTYKARNTR